MSGEEKEEEIAKGPLLGQRHLQVFLLFTSIVVNFIAKYNASVAVVAMTNANTTNPNFPEYDWNEMEKSYIQSSFFWGYLLTQFPGGYFCSRFGAKRAMFISTFGSSLLCLLPPLCVSWGGWGIYCAIRLIQGLFQGIQFPCLFANLAAWCPVNERTRLGALAVMGIECGTLLAVFLSGLIAASNIGWPGLFYVSGGMGLVWCVAWLIFSANEPSESKFISLNELKYINASKNITKEEDKEGEVEGKTPVPWRAILTSMPVWALIITRSAYSWGFNTLQAQIPSYMKGVHKMDMNKNALYSALPYLAMLAMSNVCVIVSDVLLNHNILSLTALRKSFNTVAYWIPAFGLITVGFLDENQTSLVIVLITAIVGINAASTIGNALNIIDLSPNYADIIMGIANTVASIVPVFTPLVVGVIVSDDSDRTQWQIVFIITAVIYVVCDLVYLIFGRMEVQPWNDVTFLQQKSVDKFEEARAG